jgi:SAM-dependent methyltransferase
MRQDEIWDADAAQRYDTPGTGMFDPDLLRHTVDHLAGLAGNGAALELAIGTGRVAIPLAERGVPVTGIELSEPMIDQLRRKVDDTVIPVVVGDMASTRAPGDYTLVYLVFNTISNLLSQDEQVACFQNAARHLLPGGRFVIELGVPDLRMLPPGQRLSCSPPSPTTSVWTPTTSSDKAWFPIISGSTGAGTRSCSGARTATSGRPNWT